MGLLTKITDVFFAPKVSFRGLSDDSYLKRLARDYEAGKTSWVFARDMAEYYNFADMHNLFQDPDLGNWIDIKVSLHANAHLISTWHRAQHRPKDAFV